MSRGARKSYRKIVGMSKMRYRSENGICLFYVGERPEEKKKTLKEKIAKNVQKNRNFAHIDLSRKIANTICFQNVEKGIFVDAICFGKCHFWF